ncbi:MAG TPA: carboxypeptidase-like regulatory domain-containing protein [Candidatus Dormibacteraeota bacterium]|nr:carboxypeptidase-like regulatory domain-containing protein [Candidatus Dormibacteraeota bacterium]
MRAKKYILMPTLAFLLLLASVAHAATVRGQLVFASSNAPAPYVAVRLNSQSKGPSEFAYSGNDGKYYLRNVPAGAYQLEVWRGGKVVLTLAVTVQEPLVEVPPARLP